jgi:hypothetical protein
MTLAFERRVLEQHWPGGAEAAAGSTTARNDWMTP